MRRLIRSVALGLIIILLAMASTTAFISPPDPTPHYFGPISQAPDNEIIQNVSEHSWIFVNGYLEESRILQTHAGFAGQKVVLGTSGSGMATRTIDSVVYNGLEDCGPDKRMVEGISLTISGNYDYRPYIPPMTQSDLKNALCAKNYEVGSVFSESYNIDKDLIKDTKI